ncbi:hypothetical protein Mpsy_2906 [Methanolobus psychrophilus R15]|nr:hypothetical protein Mpsy_2906 [Methanolobus psychrophilus R15]
MQTKWLFVLVMVVFSLAVSGCTGSDDESATYEYESEEDGVEFESTIPADTEDSWCPVGSSWTSSNPSTGEVVSMEITGSEEIDGVQMCKAEFNSNNPDDEYAKIDYMWSEDGESFSWKYYDTDGNLVSEMTMKDGQMRFVAEDGTVTEVNTNN